ncbi:MAG: hypothetical protein CMJ85_00675 [Planctomycetes bacterium]|nr:hypothetical protein [Planctomycetota bacterium]
MKSHAPLLATGAVLAAVAGGLRLAQAWRVPVPSTDGASYLWIAEALARGDFVAGLDHVFHPGAPLAWAPLIAVGVDAHLAAKLVGVVCGAVAAVFVWLAARGISDDRKGLWAALLFAGCFLAVRLPADAYSEAVYLVPAAAAVCFAVRGRVTAIGLAAGIAFWVRPEALCLVPLVFVRGVRRGTLGVFVLVAVAAVYPLARWLFVGELDLTPKADFMASMGPLAAPDVAGVLLGLGHNLLRVPLEAIPALDWVVFPLGLAGLLVGQRRQTPLTHQARMPRLVLAALVLGWLAMIPFQVKPRFFLSQAPLLLPFAPLAFRHARWLLFAGLALSLWRTGSDIVRPPRTEKRAERVTGEQLAERGIEQGQLATDLPRIAYYAGLRPPLPVVWTPLMLTDRLDDPAVRWVVFGALHEGRRALLGSRRDFRLLAQPDRRLLLAERR